MTKRKICAPKKFLPKAKVKRKSMLSFWKERKESHVRRNGDKAKKRTKKKKRKSMLSLWKERRARREQLIKLSREATETAQNVDKPIGYLEQVSFHANDWRFLQIDAVVGEFLSMPSTEGPYEGPRTLFHEQDHLFLKERLSVPLKKLTKTLAAHSSLPNIEYRAQNFAIIIAPAKSRISDAYAKGLLHRDSFDSETYTCLLNLCDVTKKNGAVEIWPDTLHTTLDDNERDWRLFKKGKESQLLTGGKGTINIFDSRLLHQSLPNSTNVDRIVLSWTLNPMSQPPLEILTGTGNDEM